MITELNMDVKSLRIGNYVITELGNIREVKEIHENGIKWYSEHRKHFIPFLRIEPIPLTEQWLIDFGFNKTEFAKILNNTQFVKRIHDNLWIVVDIEDGFCHLFRIVENKKEPHKIIIPNKTDKAHLLQNLYFTLTGTELKKQ